MNTIVIGRCGNCGGSVVRVLADLDIPPDRCRDCGARPRSRVPTIPMEPTERQRQRQRWDTKIGLMLLQHEESTP